jgi:hypothetical protein
MTEVIGMTRPDETFDLGSLAAHETGVRLGVGLLRGVAGLVNESLLGIVKRRDLGSLAANPASGLDIVTSAERLVNLERILGIALTLCVRRLAVKALRMSERGQRPLPLHAPSAELADHYATSLTDE